MTERDHIDIELFPCAGGMAEGFRRAGVIFDIAIEIAEDHCESYEQNLGHRPLQMDARAFLELLKGGWRPPKRVRMLVADPPCTPWSRAGKRLGQGDPRDMLEGTCQIIALLQPDVYLIGNVPGLDDGPNLPITQRVIGGLSKYGYCTADFTRLDAANYGVPQHRHRPFWFGHRAGTPCIQWPEPTHGDPELASVRWTLPGIYQLTPWVTCRQALGHLPLELLGRPIRLRKREQNSLQSGSVAERPARVVGTSNLSDGNVLLFPDQPRAGKRGRRSTRGSQGNRVGDMDKPGATIVSKPGRKGAGAHSVFTLQPPRGSDGGLGGLNTLDEPAHAIVRNTHGNGSIMVLNDKHRPAQLDAPSPTVGAKQRGQSGVLQYTKNHPPSTADDPAMTVRAGDGGGARNAIEWNDKHAPVDADAPATTIRGGGEGHSAPAVVIRALADSQGMRVQDPNDTPATVTTRGNNNLLEWPWDRPSTTLQNDERVAPPGHHDENFAVRSLPGGIVISELAATILQGFPETWVFIGKTKKIRWGQIGQAMPPPLAHAVATSVVQQLARSLTGATDGKDRNEETAAQPSRPNRTTPRRSVAAASARAVPREPDRA